jgi:hypothetical protein
MKYFSEYQGPDWSNRKAQQPEPNYNERHVHVSEILKPNGEKISLSGQETQTVLDPEQGALKTVTRDIATPLACGCVPTKDMRIRMFPDGQAVCETHYLVCSLCSAPILPNLHSKIPIDGNSQFFHRDNCAEIVLRQLLQNEQQIPSLPQATRILLENMYQDIRASRSWLYRFFTGRRSNGLLFR